jgi:hypothetical protein
MDIKAMKSVLYRYVYKAFSNSRFVTLSRANPAFSLLSFLFFLLLFRPAQLLSFLLFFLSFVLSALT